MSPDNLTDEALVTRIAGGDRGALERLLARHRPGLRRVAASVAGPDGAEDVLQDAFLAVWFRAGQFDPARGNVRGWLKGLVRNRAIDAVRRSDAERRRRDRAGRESDREPDRDPVGELVEGMQRAAALRAAIEGLPRDQYRVLDLAYYLGLSHTSIAQILGCPLGTVKGRARLGLTRLRTELGQVA